MREKSMVYKSGFALLASAFVLTSAVSGFAAGPVSVMPGQSKSAVIIPAEDEKPVSLSLRLGAGYMTGEANEIVYWPDLGNYKASELTWKIDSLYMVGVGASFRTGRWFTLNFDGWFNATDGDGTMDDYDWSVPGFDWTDWSQHNDTDVTAGSMIDINGQISFYRTARVTFNGYLGYKRDNFAWDARGGDFVYSVNGFRDTTGSFTDGLLVISYEQTLEVPYFGFGVETDFGKFKLNGRFIYSPLVKGEAVDDHYLRDLVTVDTFNDGSMIAIDIEGVYKLTANLALEAGIYYQSYDTMQGDSEWRFSEPGGTSISTIKDGAGMNLETTLLSFSVLYAF